jgi:[ribosomal protein S5]-alanine N-acetyltransferase
VRLATERLELVACTAELAEALQGDRERASELLGAELPEGWPDEELTGLLAGMERAALPFAWIAIERGERVVVGSAGFTGAPKDGAVELGFGVHERYRNSGYATEAAGALIEWALGQTGVREVVSECEQTNTASARVLEKLGLKRAGERGSVLLWST